MSPLNLQHHITATPPLCQADDGAMDVDGDDDDGGDFLLKDNGDDLDLRLERLEVRDRGREGGQAGGRVGFRLCMCVCGSGGGCVCLSRGLEHEATTPVCVVCVLARTNTWQQQ